MTITQEELREQLHYDPETGVLTWAIRKHKVKLGAVAGRTTPKGYIEVRLNLVIYQAHRLAWLYMYGDWPDGFIDHINRDPGDNRIANLRVVSRQQNARNVPVSIRSSTGIKGVGHHKQSGKYRAKIWAGGKQLWLGHFDTVEAAAAAYKQAAIFHHGEFACPE